MESSLSFIHHSSFCIHPFFFILSILSILLILFLPLFTVTLLERFAHGAAHGFGRQCVDEV
jgi:hypothetical protein